MTNIRCPHCKTIIPVTSIYCPYCGHKMTRKERDVAEEEMVHNPDLAGEPDFEAEYEPIQIPEGSWIGGILLGLFFNFVGVLIAIFTRGRNTKRGSGIGFFISTALIILGIILLRMHFIKIYH